MTETEFKLKSIFEDVVKDKAIDIQDNFFEIGLSSLSLTEIHQEIDNHYPGLVDITDMFEYQSIKELATFLQQRSTSSS